MQLALEGWSDREAVSCESGMGWPYLCMISGISKSIAHLRDMEFMKLKMWFQTWVWAPSSFETRPSLLHSIDFLPLLR